MKGETSVNYFNHFIHTPDILQYIHFLWIKTIYALKYLKLLFVLCMFWLNYKLHSKIQKSLKL